MDTALKVEDFTAMIREVDIVIDFSRPVSLLTIWKIGGSERVSRPINNIKIRKDLASVRQHLGEPGAASRVANHLLHSMEIVKK